MWEVPRIKKGFLSQSTEPGDEGVWRLKTDGVNIQVTAALFFFLCLIHFPLDGNEVNHTPGGSSLK